MYGLKEHFNKPDPEQFIHMEKRFFIASPCLDPSAVEYMSQMGIER